MPQNSPSPKTILFLAANPKSTTPLRLDEELREIEAGLQRSRHRDQFSLEQRWAVSPTDMQRAVSELSPQIVHFSGHGVGAGGLALESEDGTVQLVQGQALAKLFRLCVAPYTDCPVECVVLNACYSEEQANAIAQHISYVIGMSQAVGDQAARKFAVGFYDALGAGKSIPVAYEFGCASISMAGISEDLTPRLITPQIYPTPGSATLPTNPATNPPLDPTDARKLTPVIAPPQATPSPSPTPPMPPLRFEMPEGSVSLDSPFYVERPPIERDCYDTICRAGALIRIKAPRQMGKSSLMQRVLAHGKQAGYRTAYINFQSADEEFLNSIDLFLQWFCASISNELGLDERLEDYWKGVLGSKNKCTNYFQRYLLKTITEPLTLGLDEVDQVFQHPNIAQEFFGLLRAWHEKGKNEPIWQKLRLIIVHSKEVYIPLNINQSPFNVGLPIELPELTEPQVLELIARHGLNWSTAEVAQLMNVVDGHPYLLRKALYEIARGNLTLERVVQVAPTEEGLFGDHLRRHLLNLEADAELAAAMRQVIASNQAVRLEPTEAFKLRSMGLVALRGNDVEPLCNLYRTYFRDRLEVGT
ncbi:MAG: AAA-like domain-containing protein [Myxacorys chilensis ATA2-1-KO14]|nr:AAA-like domain-containing protein [Myxacorys chilensis ATA2-1-KO14]